MRFSSLIAGLLALGVEQAIAVPIEVEAPAMQLTERSHVSSMAMFQKRGLSCSSTIPHLLQQDCERLSTLGFTNYGVNAVNNAGANSVWIGNDGPYQAVFKNAAKDPVILVLWNQQFGYASSFVQTQQPRLTVSVQPGSSITVSFPEGSNGAWSALYPDTQLANGQISNAWGEYATGDYATVDVSREPNMQGNSMTIKTPGGCVSDMTTCVFTCLSGNTCGTAGSYQLLNCSGPGAASGDYFGAPSGGCQGWTSGSVLQVLLGE